MSEWGWNKRHSMIEVICALTCLYRFLKLQFFIQANEICKSCKKFEQEYIVEAKLTLSDATTAKTIIVYISCLNTHHPRSHRCIIICISLQRCTACIISWGRIQIHSRHLSNLIAIQNSSWHKLFKNESTNYFNR